ncbi:twin-arginine translocase subunit TatC [Novipirellula artificiosorum]|uniref:Sec-independent protein translocase protein TatC n=1 Tax=Novipirellula artificiosorum TaxID=2528016 RepID=A0A5C6DRR8_9BACT|nr:Sec-independent protein translocase protein TatC [Novipirellula artificiosorum]
MKEVPQLHQRTAKLCYQYVLWLYPASFRRQFATQMSETFAELVQDDFAVGAWHGIASSCRMIGHELLVCVPSQHLRCICEVVRAGQLRRYWRSVVIGSIVVGVVLTPADLVSTLLVAAVLVIVFWILASVFRDDRSATTVEVEL